MSRSLISRNADLQRLRDEGYDVSVRGGMLVMRDLPYVGADGTVRRGVLAAELSLAGDETVRPATHVAWFQGEYPCTAAGAPIEGIRHQSAARRVDDTLTLDHSFSSKPPDGYRDYHHLMTTYASIVAGPAAALDPSATPRTFPVVPPDDGEESPFHYVDTASSRARITAASERLEAGPVGIVGLGGTGSYVLDLMAKAPVREIHLFDGDVFSQHNAFRAPGAPSAEQLAERPLKVDYLRGIYSRMHRGIVAHGRFLDASSVGELDGLEFVFLCMDGGEGKKLVVEHLEERGIPFIDAGMGILQPGDALLGVLSVTTSTPGKRDHLRRRVSFSGGGDNAYERNIQVADLNALNAALAVVKWKKLRGFYLDQEGEHFTAYSVAGNCVANGDQA